MSRAEEIRSAFLHSPTVSSPLSPPFTPAITVRDRDVHFRRGRWQNSLDLFRRRLSHHGDGYHVLCRAREYTLPLFAFRWGKQRRLFRAGVAGVPVAGVPVDVSWWEQRLYRPLLTSVKWGLVQGQCCHPVAQADRLSFHDRQCVPASSALARLEQGGSVGGAGVFTMNDKVAIVTGAGAGSAGLLPRRCPLGSERRSGRDRRCEGRKVVERIRSKNGIAHLCECDVSVKIRCNPRWSFRCRSWDASIFWSTMRSAR